MLARRGQWQPGQSGSGGISVSFFTFQGAIGRAGRSSSTSCSSPPGAIAGGHAAPLSSTWRKMWMRDLLCGLDDEEGFGHGNRSAVVSWSGP